VGGRPGGGSGGRPANRGCPDRPDEPYAHGMKTVGEPDEIRVPYEGDRPARPVAVPEPAPAPAPEREAEPAPA
jgi:hypothetical protein